MPVGGAGLQGLPDGQALSEDLCVKDCPCGGCSFARDFRGAEAHLQVRGPVLSGLRSERWAQTRRYIWTGDDDGLR